MATILLVSQDSNKIDEFQKILNKHSHEFLSSNDELLILDILKVEQPDIILLDNSIKNIDLKMLYKKIHSLKENAILIMISKDDEIAPELLKTASAFLIEPVKSNILLSTINSNLRAKNSLELLSTSNQELAQSLYQLNVLYNTSSQFAGYLDKDKLIDVMFEGMDKSLGYSMACVLTFRSEKEPVLVIHSVNNVPARLLEALKLRAVINYKSLFENREIPFALNIEDLKIEKYVKNPLDEYDFSILRYDNMFSQITLSENFYGFVEIYREKEFNQEDNKCFHTIAQQVSLPLRNASLYQEIKETNVKLEKLERLKSEFISIVSHELRTPLTVIKGSVDILLKGMAGPLNEKMLSIVTRAQSNANRLSGIINDLLDLSKIEAGKMDYKFSATNIETVIDYVVTTLSDVAREKGLKLSLNLHDDFAYIFADARRLEQVLTNLISNSIKFTPAGGKIEVSTSIVDAKDLVYDECFADALNHLSGKYLQVCVADEGIGIDKKDLTHVFDKFEQIENSLSREIGGTGLGLPITRQLIDAHNGAIWCCSEVDKGSKFCFVLPISSDKTNFWINHKQLIHQARVNNETFATIVVKTKPELMEKILGTENLINKNYLNNSLLEKDEKNWSLTMVIPDGDRYIADFLKKKITTMCNESAHDSKCDIMYSYTIYPKEID